MTDTQDAQAIALFRYGLIAEFLHLPAGKPGLYGMCSRGADQHQPTLPGQRRSAALPTRSWRSARRRHGHRHGPRHQARRRRVGDEGVHGLVHELPQVAPWRRQVS